MSQLPVQPLTHCIHCMYPVRTEIRTSCSLQLNQRGETSIMIRGTIQMRRDVDLQRAWLSSRTSPHLFPARSTKRHDWFVELSAVSQLLMEAGLVRTLSTSRCLAS